MKVPEGVIVAMLTPFDKEGNINEKEVRKLVNFLIDKGVHGIFPVSSCGEYTHLDMPERKYLIDIVVDENRGRIDIIPGTGATCYQKSIELAEHARQKGCSGIVLHGPYFFKNINDIVEGHLAKVAKSVDIPVFIYNIPFFANEVTPEITANLCSIPNIVGIKDSSGNMVNVMNLIDMTRKIRPDFKVLVGAEEIMYPALCAGANGCMTAMAGIMPEFMVSIYDNYFSGNKNLALEMQIAILEMIRVMKSVNFPQGFKEALDLRGIEMGPPKMPFNDKLYSNLMHTKEKLEFIMESLLKKYFSETSLRYYNYENTYSNLNILPGININPSNPKYIGCISCNGCESDLERKSKDCSKKGNIENLDDIVRSVVSDILKDMR